MTVTSSLASAMLVLLLVAAGPAMAQQQQGQQGGPPMQQQQPCGCSPPTAGAEVCGSDDHTYPSQCHLECMAQGLPQGHRLSKVSDGTCPWKNCLDNCGKTLYEETRSGSCDMNQIDCWTETLRTKSRNAASCLCGCKEHFNRPIIGLSLDKIIGGLLREAALSSDPAQTTQCRLNALKRAAFCGDQCASSSVCSLHCDRNWFEALCACRKTENA